MRSEPFFSKMRVRLDELDENHYARNLKAVQQMDKIEFHPAVTVFAGENGAGKSTLIESIAVAAGFNAEGGRKSFRTDQDSTDLELSRVIALGRGPFWEQDGYFLRGESAYVLMSYVQELGYSGHNGGNLHHRSHGESFMDIFHKRMQDSRNSLFFIDEIESALSPQRQVEFLGLIHQFVCAGCQFIISTHSPILMSYPHSRLYWLDNEGIEIRDWKETEHFRVYRSFLERPETYYHA